MSNLSGDVPSQFPLTIIEYKHSDDQEVSVGIVSRWLGGLVSVCKLSRILYSYSCSIVLPASCDQSLPSYEPVAASCS